MLLVQLPPDFARDDARLDYFLAALPDWIRVSVEFRHPSWDDAAVYALLERHGAAYCIMSGAGLPCVLRATAPFVYVRLHGPDREHLYGGSYPDDDLRWWADRIREWQDGRQGRLRVFQQRRRRQRRPQRHGAAPRCWASRLNRRRLPNPAALPEPALWESGGMELASQQSPAQQPATGNRAFRLAHWVSDTVNSLRLKTARRWNFVPQTVAYQGYGSTTWVRVLGRVVLTSKPDARQPGGAAAQNGNQNIRGWRAFTSVPIQYSEVEIEIGGVTARVHADRGGLVDTVVQVELTPGWHTAVLRAEGTEPATAKIFVISPDTKLGIVSDIDDTIMVTALPRPFLALWNTFVLNERARMATPGMAVLMDRLMVEYPEAPVIYLSTGPWNAAPTLARFITRNMYPSGALLLTDWGLTQDRWFRSGQEHKRRNLELLAEEFPNMRWLLFGDNGQHDEAIYSALRPAARRSGGRHRHPPALRQRSRPGRRPLGDRRPHRLRRSRGSTPRTAQAWRKVCRTWTFSNLRRPYSAHRVGAFDVGSPHRRGAPGGGLRRRARDRSLRDGVPVPRLEDFPEPVKRGLPRALLGFPVHVQQPELLLVAGRPFEVVHQRPHVVAAQVDGLCRASG